MIKLQSITELRYMNEWMNVFISLRRDSRPILAYETAHRSDSSKSAVSSSASNYVAHTFLDQCSKVAL